MAKNSVDEWSTDHTQNTDVGGVGILGSNVASNIDDAARRMMAQIAEYRDSSLIQTVQERIVTKALPYNLQRIRLFYPDPDDQYKLDTIEFVRMTKNNIDSYGIESAGYVRSLDRFIPGSDEPSTTNGGYWVNDTPVMKVNQFGTGFAAAQAALKHHAIMGRTLDFGEGIVYEGTDGAELSIPTNSRIIGDAAFEFDGSVEDELDGEGNIVVAHPTVTIGDNVRAKKLRFHTPGGATLDKNQTFVEIGDNYDIDYLEISADEQRRNRGIGTGPNGRVTYLKSRKIDRPFMGNSGGEEGSVIEIGFADIDGYVRGVNFIKSDAVVFGFDIRGASPNGTNSAGQNGFLLTECPRVRFPSGGSIEGSSEHAIRLGGTLVFESGPLFIKNTGGCALKGNSPTVRSQHIHVESIHGTNIGQTGGGNIEMVRLTRCDDIFIGHIHSAVEDGYLAPRRAVQLNNCIGIRVGLITGVYRHQFIAFAGDSDTANPDGPAGPVEDFYFKIGKATCGGGSAVVFEATTINGDDPVMTVGNGVIEFAGPSGWSTNTHSFGYDGGGSFDPVEITAPIYFIGHQGGDVAPQTSDAGTDPGHNLIFYNLTWKDKVRIGQASQFRTGSNGILAMQELIVPTDSAFAGGGDVVGRGIVINGQNLSSGAGKYSAFIEWSRPGSARRGAAIGIIQEGSSAQNTSLDLFAGFSGGSAASDALTRVMRASYRGTINLPNAPTYADNAAAVSGGLSVGDVYKTDGGDLRIVVSS